MPKKVQDARKEAADTADQLSGMLNGAKVHAKRHRRILDHCPACGGTHEWEGRRWDDTDPDKHGRVSVRFWCPVRKPLGTIPVATARAQVMVEAYKLPSGSVQHVQSPRWMPETWEACPEQLQRQLMKCSRDAVVRGRKSGGLIAVPCKCNGGSCPRCAQSKAARRVRSWRPFFDRLNAAGCVLVHVTLTQPADLYEGERLPTRGPELVAVGGESLGDAMDRFRAAWDRMRNSRRTRDDFRRSVVGYVYGIEATGKAPRGPRRYHVHGHALLALHPDALRDATWARHVGRCTGCGGKHDVTVWTDEEGGGMRHWCPKMRRTVVATQWVNALSGGTWWDWWVSEWTRTSPGAKPEGQVAHALTGPGEQVEDALSEVLKYPFKPSNFTIPQVLEWQATVKGRCLHLSGGALHPSSTLRRAALGDDAALARLDPVLLPLVEPVRQAVEQREEEKEAAETLPVQVRILDEVDGWDVASVRRVLAVAERNGGWLELRVWDLEADDWHHPQTQHVDAVLAQLLQPPPPPPDKS